MSIMRFCQCIKTAETATRHELEQWSLDLWYLTMAFYRTRWYNYKKWWENKDLEWDGARILGNIVEKMGDQAEEFRAVEMKWEVSLFQERSRFQVQLLYNRIGQAFDLVAFLQWRAERKAYNYSSTLKREPSGFSPLSVGYRITRHGVPENINLRDNSEVAKLIG
jgi:hypothetical protein